MASRGCAPGPLSPIRNRSTSFRFLNHKPRGNALDEHGAKRDAKAAESGSARVWKIAPGRTVGARRIDAAPTNWRLELRLTTKRRPTSRSNASSVARAQCSPKPITGDRARSPRPPRRDLNPLSQLSTSQHRQARGPANTRLVPTSARYLCAVVFCREVCREKPATPASYRLDAKFAAERGVDGAVAAVLPRAESPV